jgi:DNA polymerase II small subunit
MSGLTYSKPEDAMLELLRRRHLSPIYGDNLIVPEEKDYLVIDEEPDVMHMGHVHKNGWMTYRGTMLLNSGTFQDRTDFQVRMGHMPSPGVVPVLEGQTGKLHHISFMGASQG